MAYKEYSQDKFEYTPEINQAYLEQLQKPIKERGRAAIGQARGEALRRGMEGDPYEALRVGATESDTASELAGTEAQLGYAGAGMQREERLQDIGRQYGTTERESSQQFSSIEAEKNRKFQLKMAAMNQAFEREMERAGNKINWGQTLASAGGYALGTYLGGGIGGGVGAKAGSALAGGK